ncbi:MAG TPA: DnaA regulatory inactivator Hda [Paenalcaligenes sp.]|nr:DnaA regulatory inactivator Hda [Paenalcaligenes sp.]
MNQQLILDISPAPTPTLDNFIVGTNQQALQALQQCQPGRAVYLWGNQGSGRTHLLQAMVHEHQGRYFSAFTPSAQLLELSSDDTALPPLLAVDDIDLLNRAAQAALFGIYNRWRLLQGTKKAFILITAGAHAPMHLKLREDLRTRIAWDLVFYLEQLCDDARAQAINSRAQARGLQLTPEVIRWMLTHYSRNMSRLSALVDALDHHSLVRKRAITIPFLRQLLAEQSPKKHDHE